MNIETGGPAFPTESEAQTGCSTWRYEGMTLRDYMAAKAMQGVLVNTGRHKFRFDRPADISEYAYMLADAMLAARDMGMNND